MSKSFLPEATLRDLRRVFVEYPDLAGVVLYGSYATGRATPRSDIDLATKGITDHYRIGHLALDLEDLPIPQKCDVQAYESIDYEPLRRHIDERGVTIYERAATTGGPMKRVYKAILRGDRVEWLDGAPDADEPLQIRRPGARRKVSV